jgi:hypothetical protein
MSEKKEYQKKYYQKNKVRKPYVITQKVPLQEWSKPDEEGQLLETDRYIFYINKIWSKHILNYMKITDWGAFTIYDINKNLIRLKIGNIISYIDKYHKNVTLNPQNT